MFQAVVCVSRVIWNAAAESPACRISMDWQALLDCKLATETRCYLRAGYGRYHATGKRVALLFLAF